MLVEFLDEIDGVEGVRGADEDARVDALLDEHCRNVYQVLV